MLRQLYEQLEDMAFQIQIVQNNPKTYSDAQLELLESNYNELLQDYKQAWSLEAYRLEGINPKTIGI